LRKADAIKRFMPGTVVARSSNSRAAPGTEHLQRFVSALSSPVRSHGSHNLGYKSRHWALPHGDLPVSLSKIDVDDQHCPESRRIPHETRFCEEMRIREQLLPTEIVGPLVEWPRGQASTAGRKLQIDHPRQHHTPTRIDTGSLTSAWPVNYPRVIAHHNSFVTATSPGTCRDYRLARIDATPQLHY
jgi:hypothetical protein